MDSRAILLLLLGSWAARAGIGCRMAQPLLLSSSAGPGQGSRERRLSVNSAAVAARSGCRCDSLVVPALCVADALAVAVCFAASVGFDARLLFAEVTGHRFWFVGVAGAVAARGLVLTAAACTPAAPWLLRAGVAALALCSSVAQLMLVGVFALGGPLIGLSESTSPIARVMALVASGCSGTLSGAAVASLLYAVGFIQHTTRLDLMRYAISTCITALAFGVVGLGISRNQSVLPGPPSAVVSAFVCSVALLWHLEGVQVAILAVEGTEVSSFAPTQARGGRLQALMLRDQGVQRFLVGRQFLVIFVVYLTAQVTTFRDIALPIPDWATVALIDTGLPGVMIVLAVGQLMPQLMAAEDPRWFMSLPGCLPTVYLCLGLERLGVTHFAWMCASAGKAAMKMSGSVSPKLHNHAQPAG